MGNDTLTITDNRTNTTFTIPITHGAIRAMDLRQIKTGPEDFGLMTYDPAFMNTASCRSTITYIDGDRGILRYRGYPIEQLAGNCSFLEVAYLTLNGELPTQPELEAFTGSITCHTMVPENIKRLMDSFNYDAHPMSMLACGIAALSNFYPEAKKVRNRESRQAQIVRLIAKVPTVGAYAYRRRLGLPYVAPDNSLSYPGNFMNMLWKMTEPKYEPNPVLQRALDILFILHADHEQNCSANAMRSVGSSEADPYMSAAAAIGALFGPLHGGANEQVLVMLDQIGSVDNIPTYVEKVKAGQFKLMGFGHRIYKNYDPRAKIIKQAADEVFKVTGRNPKLDVAIELERIALSDEYFVKRKLYPNVDFYSGIIYQAMGFTPDMFTVLFAIPRMAGWLAQWQELIEDPEQKIARPRQLFLGHDQRDFVPIDKRVKAAAAG
ncbi:MAG: citrate synthase [Acidobacteriota bacterium]